MNKLQIAIWTIIVFGITLYVAPLANCVVNGTTTCLYPFYKRGEISRKLILSKEEFIENSDTYNKLAKLLDDGWFQSIQRRIGTSEIQYSLPSAWTVPGGFPEKHRMDDSLKINGKNLNTVFNDLRILKISRNKIGMTIVKENYKRGFTQYYILGSKDSSNLIKDSGGKIDNLWNGWYLQTFGELK